MSNLFKAGYTIVKGDETRIIDSNKLAERKIGALPVKVKSNNKKASFGGFSAGLAAEKVEILYDENGEPIDKETLARQQEEKQLNQKKAEAGAIIEKARAEADSMREAAKREIEALKNETYAQAKAAGYQDGEAEAKEAYRKKEEKILADERKVVADYEEKTKQLEPLFIETLTDIYEHVIGVSLKDNQKVISHLISETLRQAGNNREFVVRVSKKDVVFVREHIEEIIDGVIPASSIVEVIEDSSLTDSECLVETSGGVFDCGLDTQLAELRKELTLLCYEGKNV